MALYWYVFIKTNLKDLNEHPLYPLHTFVKHLPTASELEQLGFTNDQTPNKCTCHIKGDFRILLFEEEVLFQKKYRNDWPTICKLKSIGHLKMVYFSITGEELI